jgi:hypothetical protein
MGESSLMGTTITIDGGVGIGTTQPSSDFNVVGDTIISGTTTITIIPTNPKCTRIAGTYSQNDQQHHHYNKTTQ